MNDYNGFCSTITGFLERPWWETKNDYTRKTLSPMLGNGLVAGGANWRWIRVPPVHVLSTFPGGRSTFSHVRSTCCPRSILVMSQAPIPGNMQRLYWESLNDHTRKISLHVLANPGMSSLRTTMPGKVHGIIGYISLSLSLSCPKQLQPTKQQIQSKIGHVMNRQARQSSPDDLLGVSTRRRAAVDARRNHWDPRYPKIAG